MAISAIDRQRRNFLHSLKSDLSAAGYSIRKSTKKQFRLTLSDPNPTEQIRFLRAIHRRQLDTALPFIEKLERGGVLELFSDGKSINIDAISPQIRFCNSRTDHEVFSYAKLFQQVPAANRVGRQIRAMIFDVGQTKKTLMGILELASTPYTLGCRDDYLGWRGQTRKRIKDTGLRRIMDLATVMALPPYNLILGGKLMAALALTGPIGQEFHSRYRTQLLGLTSTSALGLHCAILNRIGLRPGGLYQRIGATSGYTTLFASEQTLKAAKAFLPSYFSAPTGEFSISVRPIHILRKALTSCGVKADSILRSGNCKGVYFGTTVDENIDALRNGKLPQDDGSLSIQAVTTYWHRRFVQNIAANDQKLVKFRAFTRTGPGNYTCKVIV